ncbi:MAG: hypothetical protein ACP5I8_14720 [Phycisphaerae bacterium]
MHFFDAFDHVIDNKNRMAIPAPHRQEIPESISGKKRLCARPIEQTSPNGEKRRFIELIPEPIFIALAQKESKEDSLELSMEEQDRRRGLFAGVKLLEIDEQGRVVMPDDFLDRPEKENDKKRRRFAVNILGREVVVVGVGSRMEVWNAEEYHRRFDGAGKVRAA